MPPTRPPADAHWYDALLVRITMLEGEVQRLRDWRHEMGNVLMPIQQQLSEIHAEVVERRAGLPADPAEGRLSRQGEDRHLTMRDVYVFSAAVGLTVGALKVFGVL